jgi:hypothetical protein
MAGDSPIWGLPNRTPTLTDRIGSDSSAVAPTSRNTFDQVKTLFNTNGIFDLTSGEVTQLANIDTSTISSSQWAFVGTMDQDVDTTASANFANLRVNTLTTLNGIVTTDASGDFSSSVTLPDGTLAIPQPLGDNTDKVATTSFVKAAVDVENLWDRDISGAPFVKPFNSGDDVNMINGKIYTIDPSNTSGTKSYEISETLTGVVPASEHAKFSIKGLSQGSQKEFFIYEGASNTTKITAEDWTFDNTVGTIGQALWKTNINATGGSGFFFDEVFGRNSAAAETIYYQDRAIIATNTAGSEDGIHVFDVVDGGTLTEYMRLDGGTKSATIAKNLTVTGSITSAPGAVDGIGSWENASSVETIKLDTNGVSFFAGGDLEIRGNNLFLDNTQTVNFANSADSANSTIKMVVGDTFEFTAFADMKFVSPLDFVIDCEQDVRIEAVGIITLDAVNAAADSTINLTNTDGTFNTKFEVNGVEIVGANSKVNGPLVNSIVYTDNNTDLAGVTMGLEDQPILSDGAANPKPKFGTLRHAPSVISAAGATPVDSDVSTWNSDTHGIVVGTGGRVWFAFKNSTDVYYVEATAI